MKSKDNEIYESGKAKLETKIRTLEKKNCKQAASKVSHTAPPGKDLSDLDSVATVNVDSSLTINKATQTCSKVSFTNLAMSTQSMVPTNPFPNAATSSLPNLPVNHSTLVSPPRSFQASLPVIPVYLLLHLTHLVSLQGHLYLSLKYHHLLKRNLLATQTSALS